jgi:prepilin peptidase CpaA
MVFPNQGFAWVFYFSIIAILAIATYFDLRYLTIPKPLSIVALFLGVAMNLLRGAWVGWENDGLSAGLLDGFLFSLGGFATGFGIFFALWIMGLCGGGDVKLFAATAAWLGWYGSFWLWVGSVVALALVASARMMLHTTFAGIDSTKNSFFASANVNLKSPTSPKPRRRLLPYSLPLMIAAVVMLLWFFRVGLGFVAASPAQ